MLFLACVELLQQLAVLHHQSFSSQPPVSSMQAKQDCSMRYPQRTWIPLAVIAAFWLEYYNQGTQDVHSPIARERAERAQYVPVAGACHIGLNVKTLPCSCLVCQLCACPKAVERSWNKAVERSWNVVGTCQPLKSQAKACSPVVVGQLSYFTSRKHLP